MSHHLQLYFHQHFHFHPSLQPHFVHFTNLVVDLTQLVAKKLKKCFEVRFIIMEVKADLVIVLAARAGLDHFGIGSSFKATHHRPFWAFATMLAADNHQVVITWVGVPIIIIKEDITCKGYNHNLAFEEVGINL